MKSGKPKEAGTADRGVDAVAVQIGLDERWDALRLMEALIPFHSFLVQYEREHWVVQARVPGCHGESLDELVAAIEDWGAESGVTEFTCFLNDQVVAPVDERSAGNVLITPSVQS